MDGPTARRRRHASSANSVTVAQLKAKSTQAQQASVSAIRARAEAGSPPHDRTTEPGPGWTPHRAQTPEQPDKPPSTELVKYDDPTTDRGTSNRLARAIVITIATMAACGVVAALAVLIGGRPQRLSPSVPIVQPAVVSGPMVVRPKAMIEQLASGALGQIPAEPAGGAGGEAAPSNAEHGGALANRTDAVTTVAEFYGALPRSGDAFSLLGPSMQVGGRELFNDGWLSTRSVEARPLPPRAEDGGRLRIAVSIEQFDGSVLQLVQLVEVRPIQNDGQPPGLRIVGVQLLAAYQG